MSLLLRYVLLLSLPLFLLDFVTKEWTVRRFAPPDPVAGWHDFQTVVPGVFDLVRIHNTGVAFGMGNGREYANWIFGTISLTALLGVAIFWKKEAFPTRVAKTAAALVISGIAGNLLDRLLRGYVVDFLLVDLKFMVWPAFNVADACICIAAGLLIITSFQKVPEPETKADSAAA
jgi:signal peptidase II